MTSEQRLAQVTRARGRVSKRPTTGDEFRGGPCPSDRRHGNMLVLPSGNRYCPHSDHADGTSALHPAIQPEA